MMNNITIIMLISILGISKAMCGKEIKILDGVDNTITCTDLGDTKKGCNKMKETDFICFLKPLENAVNNKCYSYTCTWNEQWVDFKINITLIPPYKNIHVDLEPKYDMSVLVELLLTLCLICCLSSCYIPDILVLDTDYYSYSSNHSSGYC